MEMTLDEQVLTQTKEIRERLLDSERELEHLRADYHHSIRLLAARGGNMREIADALSLSHQRVHQIVGAGGEEEPRGGFRGGPHHRGRGHHGPERGRGFRGFLGRFAEPAREVVGRASQDARELAHGSVEAPHLLLALAEVDPRVGGAVDPTELRTKVAALYPQGTEPRRGRMRFGHTARHTLALAMQEAVHNGEGLVEPRHLALALTGDGAPREELGPLGLDLERIRHAFPEDAA
jgi:hypothetical protein